MDLIGAEALRGDDSRASAPADRSSAIRDAILFSVVGQRLAPGTKLPEDQLAAHVAVSRTSVRGALRSLVGDGVVVLARHRSAAVASPSP